MRFLSLFIATLLLSFACLIASESTVHCNHHCHRSNNDFIPSVRLQLTPDLCSDWFAVSFLGEAGVRNYRANGTVGIALDPCQRVKVGAEYLTQKLNYHFSSGKHRKWVYQYAVGGGYQYLIDYNLFDCKLFKSFDLYGHYSHADSHRLRTLECKNVPLIERRIERRIAGSDAYNVGGGITLNPWCGTDLSLSLDYDNVRYDRKFRKHKTIAGFGGTVSYFQCLPCNFNISFIGEFRRPYNYLEAVLGWAMDTCYGGINIGIYGGHTYGKERLPSSTVAGIALNWTFGGSFCNNCFATTNSCCACTPCNDLARWIALAPAVYVPEVLAIAEERSIVNILCITPTVLGTMGPLQFTDADLPTTIATANLFDGHGQTLTFSLAVDAPEVNASIDPVTGVITLNEFPGDMIHTLTVTATTPGGCNASTTVQIQLVEAAFEFPPSFSFP